MATFDAVMKLDLTREEIDLLVHMASLGITGLMPNEKANARELLQRLKKIKEGSDEENSD